MIRRSSLQAYFAGALVVLGTAAFVDVAAGKPVESFTAMASAKVDANSKDAVQVDVRIVLDRWSNEEERGSVMKAVKTGGTPALHKLLSAMPDTGTIEVGLCMLKSKDGGERIEREIRVGAPLTDEQRTRLSEIAGKTPVTRSITAGVPIATAVVAATPE